MGAAAVGRESREGRRGYGKAPGLDCHVSSLINQEIENHGNCLGCDTCRKLGSGNWWLEGSPQLRAVLTGAGHSGQRMETRLRKAIRLSKSGRKMSSSNLVVSQ